MNPAAGGQNTPQDAGTGGVVSGGRDAAQADSAPPIVTVFGQLRSGEIHEFGTVEADAGDTAEEVTEALADLLRACADEVTAVAIDPELGPDAARWVPREQRRQDEP